MIDEQALAVAKLDFPASFEHWAEDAIRTYLELAEPWISVNEKMPEDRQSVAFVVSEECKMLPAGKVLGGTYSTSPYWGFSIPGIGGIPATHWMPLPEPPTKAPEENA